MSFFIILQIEGRVNKGEIGEEPLGRAADGQLEQIIVGFPRIVVDPVLHPENLDGEDGGLPIAQAGLGSQHDIFHHHPAFRRGVHPIVNRRERRLSPCPGVHGVQVVDQGLHGLIGRPVGLLGGPIMGKGLALAHLRFILAVMGQQKGHLCLEILLTVLQLGIQAGLFLNLLDIGLDLAFRVCLILQQHHRPSQILAINPLERLPHSHGHGIIKVHNGLPAMLVVLIGLNGDAGQGCIRGNVVGLPQCAVPCGEAPIKELNQVNLGTGGGPHRGKVHVMDVDIPAGVGPGMLRLHHKHLIELLRPLAAVLKHSAHGSVSVDVGVLPLNVAVLGGGEGNVLVNFHQAGVHLPGPVPLGAVEDIRLGCLNIAIVHQHPFHDILDMFHIGAVSPFHLQHRGHLMGQLGRGLLIARFIGGLKRLVDGVCNLILMEGDHSSVPLPNLLYRGHRASLLLIQTPISAGSILWFSYHKNTRYCVSFESAPTS